MSDLQLAFREAFLWRLGQTGAAGTFRAFGDLLFDLLNEGGQWGTNPNSSSILGELRAHAEDFAHTLADMERLAEHLRDGDDQDETALADRINGWIGRISLVVLDIHRRLDCHEDEPQEPKP